MNGNEIAQLRLGFNPMHDLIPLELLAAGSSGRIGQLLGTAEEVHRLEEIGMRVGVKIEVLQEGAACIIRLDEATLCYRLEQCVRVLVKVDSLV